MSTATSLDVGFLGTRHVHSQGIAAILTAMGHRVVAAAEDDAAAAAAWNHSPLTDAEQTIAASDAIVVCGTNRERAADAIRALEADKPILCEKPIGTSIVELDALEAAATGKLFMTALPVRFSAAFQQAKQLIDSGYVGTPIAARGTNHGQYPGGWFGDATEAGGGAIMDHTVHLSDALCWLLDDRIERVYTAAGTYMHDLDVDDCAIVTCDFAGGAYASIDASWSRPASYENWGNVWLELAGTEGRIIVDPLARKMTWYDDSAGKQRILPFGDNMTRSMLEAWVSYIRQGGDSPVSFAEGRHASEVCLAAYRSIGAGQPVSV